MNLLEALSEQFPESSRTTLRQMLQADRVRVNGVPTRDAKQEVGDDDRVEVGPRSTRPQDPRVRILYEDADVVVVDKIAGLLTVPTEEVLHENAEAILGALHVHRLDRDTSGVLVFAKNTWIRERLQAQFAVHDIDRIYVAIVHGKVKPPAGTFRSFLLEGEDLRVKSAPEGKEAITHYRTVASGRRFSMLEVTLETGRRNQIRVHLSEAGHPIVGDTMYGRGRDESLRRLGLHAKQLGFVHPRTGKRLTFTSELPREFRDLQL